MAPDAAPAITTLAAEEIARRSGAERDRRRPARPVTDPTIQSVCGAAGLYSSCNQCSLSTGLVHCAAGASVSRQTNPKPRCPRPPEPRFRMPARRHLQTPFMPLEPLLIAELAVLGLGTGFLAGLLGISEDEVRAKARSALTELGLTIGTAVRASFKAGSVHLIPRR